MSDYMKYAPLPVADDETYEDFLITTSVTSWRVFLESLSHDAYMALGEAHRQRMAGLYGSAFKAPTETPAESAGRPVGFLVMTSVTSWAGMLRTLATDAYKAFTEAFALETDRRQGDAHSATTFD